MITGILAGLIIFLIAGYLLMSFVSLCQTIDEMPKRRGE